jgi:hypothetical protein
MYLGFRAKYPLLVLDFNDWIFWTDFRDKLIKFNKSPSNGNGLFMRKDRQTKGSKDRRKDRQTNDEANSRLLQFCERTYKLLFLLVIATTVK